MQQSQLLDPTLDLIQSLLTGDKSWFGLNHKKYSVDINFFFVYTYLESAIFHGHGWPFLQIRPASPRAGSVEFSAQPQKNSNLDYCCAVLQIM